MLRQSLQWERSVAQRGRHVIVSSLGGAPARYIDGKAVFRSQPTHVLNCVAHDVDHLIAAGDSGAVMHAGRAAPIARHDTIVNGMAIHAQSGQFASGDYRGGVVIGELGGAWEVRCLIPGGPVNSLAWTAPDRIVTSPTTKRRGTTGQANPCPDA